jgi:2-polyprenyl-6-methoxyphenol hydroxylase-like FAD-dependent oxidoreductase
MARREAGMRTHEYPMNVDVWWFRLPMNESIGEALLPHLNDGKAFVLVPRSDYIQAAHFIPKGSDQELRGRGIEAFRRDIAETIPELAAEAEALASLDDVKFLDVRLNRLRRWHTEGLLCIGDAAHAMSPLGGVGINLAVQDAVAAATLLADPLLEGRVTSKDLDAVRRRRLPATTATQLLQRGMHKAVGSVLAGKGDLNLPKPVRKLFKVAPQLTVVPAYLIGIGLRPERAPEFARR